MPSGNDNAEAPVGQEVKEIYISANPEALMPCLFFLIAVPVVKPF
jgi:hypothetical protein